MSIKARPVLACCIVLLVFSFAFVPVEHTINAKDILNKLFAANDQLKTLKYELKISERVKGVMHEMGSQVKLQRKPRKLYLFMKGTEVLWVEGENNGKALVNPGTFPYVNLNLDPYGLLMRDGQHHTIHEMGYDYLISILKYQLATIGDKFSKTFYYTGEEKINEHVCYKVLISNDDFGYKDYIVQDGEDLVKIARKFYLSEYMILEKNNLKFFDDVSAGQKIKIPTAYAKTVLLYIDKETMLPLMNKVLDDKGMFEVYEYKNLQVNPTIAPEEFTKKYKGYKF